MIQCPCVRAAVHLCVVMVCVRLRAVVQNHFSCAHGGAVSTKTNIVLRCECMFATTILPHTCQTIPSDCMRAYAVLP